MLCLTRKMQISMFTNYLQNTSEKVHNISIYLYIETRERPLKDLKGLKTMKEILKRLETAVKIMNNIDDMWENDPENADLEKAWGEAYNAEYEIRKELATAITKLTNEIDFDTALKMTYNPKTAELIKATV